MKIDFEEICKKYGDRLYAAAFQICRQPQDAEDAVQEAFIRLYHSDKDFESEEHIKAWLIRVNDSFDAPISGDDTTKTTTVVISD